MPQVKLECNHAQTFTCTIIPLFFSICQKIINYIPIQEQHTEINYGVPNAQCELCMSINSALYMELPMTSIKMYQIVYYSPTLSVLCKVIEVNKEKCYCLEFGLAVLL